MPENDADRPLLKAPLCRDFTGYRPCRPFRRCENCEEMRPVGTSILLVNLDAMGDVLMTTAALPAIMRRWPDASVTWLTLPSCMPLLEGNPLVWRVFPYDWETVNVLLNEFSLTVGRLCMSLALVRNLYPSSLVP